MSYHERHRDQHPERARLEGIRRELGLQPDRPRNPCPVCGAERCIPIKPTRPGTKPWAPLAECIVCGGQRVRAANLLRAILEIASPTRGGFFYETTDTERQRRSGQVETVSPILSGRSFNDNEND